MLAIKYNVVMQVQKYGLMIMPMKNDFGYEMSLMELTE